MLVTPHPLGGCNMAAAAGAGVTNHMGEVYGHHNLFVMDGSVIPRAIGRNPSKTIAAVAERSCEKLLDGAARLASMVRGAGLARRHARRAVRGVDVGHVLHRIGGVERQRRAVLDVGGERLELVGVRRPGAQPLNRGAFRSVDGQPVVVVGLDEVVHQHISAWCRRCEG